MTIRTDQELLGACFWQAVFQDTCKCDDSFDPEPNMQEAYEQYMGMCASFQRQTEKMIDDYLKWRTGEEV